MLCGDDLAEHPALPGIVMLEPAMSASCLVLLSSFLTSLCVPHMSLVLPDPPPRGPSILAGGGGGGQSTFRVDTRVDGVTLLQDVLDILMDEKVDSIVVLYDNNLGECYEVSCMFICDYTS